MLRVLTFSFLCLYAAAASAEDWKITGSRSFETKPIVSDVRLSHVELSSLKESRDLIGKHGFSFLIRKDSDHWMGVSTENGVFVWRIHDATSKFNFRASVNLSTGRVTLIKGVAYAGRTPKEDARHAVEAARSYLARLRTEDEVFPVARATMAKTPPVRFKKMKVTP